MRSKLAAALVSLALNSCIQPLTINTVDAHLRAERITCNELGEWHTKDGEVRPLPIKDCEIINDQWIFAKLQFVHRRLGLNRAETNRVANDIHLDSAKLIKVDPDEIEPSLNGTDFKVPIMYMESANDIPDITLDEEGNVVAYHDKAQAYIQVAGGPHIWYTNVYALHCEFYHLFEWRLHPTLVRSVKNLDDAVDLLLDGEGLRVWEIVGHDTKDDPMHYPCWQDTEPR